MSFALLPVPLPATRRVHAVLAVIALLASLVVASTWHVFSHTWDEPEHLAAGMSLLDRFKYDYDIQHPPLGRVLMAAGPLLLGAHSVGKPPPDGRPEGVAILYDGGHYWQYLIAARAGMLVFLWLILAATFLMARRVARGDGEALTAVGLLAATPAILGHAGLAALDVPAAATMMLAIWTMLRWLEAPTRGRAAWVGVTGGIATATKLSAIPFLGIALPTLWLVSLALRGRACRAGASLPPHQALARRLGDLALAALAAIVVITLCYGGRFQYYTDLSGHFNQALYFLFGKTGEAHDLAYAFAARVPMPEAWQKLLGGIQALEVHNQNGHLSYLLGELRRSGWWYFYVVALAVKTPLPLLLPGLVGLAGLARDGWRTGDTWRCAPAALVVTLLAFVSLYSRINIGVRHVLIVYPMLAMGAAWTLARVWEAARAGGDAARVARGLLVASLGWLCVSLARTHPDYLAYFNETVSHPERVLVDSDLDWGQDLLRLERRLAELKVDHLSLGYLGTAELHREPLPPFALLEPGERASGWIAVTALARIYAHGGYDWLDAYVPLERVGRTIDLYYIPSAHAPAPDDRH